MDVAKITLGVLAIVTNEEAIAVNQAWAGGAGDRVWVSDRDGAEAWAKPLPHDSLAVVVFNRGESAISVSVSLATVGWSHPWAHARDIWDRTDETISGNITTVLAPYACRFLVLSNSTVH